MTRAERLIILATLCLTLIIATVGIVYLMARGVNVAKEVTIAIAAKWGSLLAFTYRVHTTDRSAVREL